MALIERLMGWNGEEKIHVHAFFAANVERIAGRMTRQNVIDMFVLRPADITEYDSLAAQAPAANQEAKQALFLDKIHSVLVLGEENRPGYATPAEVRAKLGI